MVKCKIYKSGLFFSEMIIKVRVKLHSGKQEVVEVESRVYGVCLKNLAEDNKANIELLKLMGRYFRRKGVVKNIKIIKGLKSRDKILEVDYENKI